MGKNASKHVPLHDEHDEEAAMPRTRPARHASDAASRMRVAADKARAKARRARQVFTAQAHRSLPEFVQSKVWGTAEEMLVKTGRAMLVSSAEVPYMPDFLQWRVDEVADVAADRVCELIHDYWVRAEQNKAHRRIFHWPPEPPFPRLLTQHGCGLCDWAWEVGEWVRLKLLYASAPADANTWKMLGFHPSGGWAPHLGLLSLAARPAGEGRHHLAK